MTASVQRVLLLFLRDPSRPFYGLQIAREAQLGGGTLYPLLNRLEKEGWLESAWEDIAVAVAAGRRPRRYYQLTDEGIEQARAVHRAAVTALAPIPVNSWPVNEPPPQPGPELGFGGT